MPSNAFYPAVVAELGPEPAARADIAIVCVLYHPATADLAHLAEMVRWGADVIAVVNAIGLAANDALDRIEGLHIVRNAANLGLAHALNQGIAEALERGAGRVLLLDQDSRPEARMIDRLAAGAQAIEETGRRLACVAPRLRDLKADSGAGRLPVCKGATLATSGSLLSRQAWNEVGPMRADLFIDGIDHEWCFRARARGFETIVIDDAVMIHDMGEAAVEMFGRFRPIHRSPVRHYFIVRNTFWLARCAHIPSTWRLKELAKLAYRIPAYLLLSNDRSGSLRTVTNALIDGLTGVARRQPVVS